jgi:CubicO group peptidase (beta-lactamase class C family)
LASCDVDYHRAVRDTLTEVDAIVDAFVADEPVPGVAYGVVLDGELIHARGIGTSATDAARTPDVDTIFRIASMTKSFTAATVLLLRDEGALRLDDPVSRYVPELADLRPPFDGAPILTIRHLLTMSAGFPSDDPYGDRQQNLDLDRFAAFLRSGPSFAWMPGTEFEYSNLGYGVLGRVITTATGTEYRDVVRTRLLEPLQMSSSAFDVESLPPERLATGYVRRDDEFVEEPLVGYGALASMGGLFSTVRDLGRWVHGFSRAFAKRDDEHPLCRASRLEMQQLHRAAQPELRWTSIADLPTAVAPGYGFGLFAILDLELGRIVAHSGGYPGFGSHMRWHPGSGVGVVVLGNRTYFPAFDVGERMLRALVRGSVAPARRVSTSPRVVAAREAVNHLIERWDDDVADRILSSNVALDEPWDRRRETIERLRTTHGTLRPSDEPAGGESPFHAVWWLEGDRGRVRVEVRLDSQSEPKVQSLDLTSVPEPEPPVRTAAEGLVAAVNGEAGEELPIPDASHRQRVERDLLLVRTLFGPCRLGRPVESDGSSATFGVIADLGKLDLAVAVALDTGMVLDATWTPRPITPPMFDVF